MSESPQEAAPPPLDPVVDRTRAARESLARRCDYDVDKMFELFRRMQAEHPQRVGRPSAAARPAGGRAEE